MFSIILPLIIGPLAFAFVIWLAIILPAKMAKKRGRSALIWVLISLGGSPILAILLLIALGNANDYSANRYSNL